MAISSLVFGEAFIDLISGTLDWVTSGATTYKVQLTDDAATPNKDTGANLSDVGNRLGGADQTADKDVAESTPTKSGGTLTVDVADASYTWSSVASGTAGGVTFYQNTGTDSTSALICINDFSGGNVTANGSDITVTPSANGIFTIAY